MVYIKFCKFIIIWNMTEERKKFDINTINVETSSQESDFNVDDQNHSEDVIDNFKTIGEDYAGTGLTGKN